MAEALGLDDLRVAALTGLGVARTTLGDQAGLEDLERSIELAGAVGPLEVARSEFNLGAVLANLGDLAGAFEHQAVGAAAAARVGEPAMVRWFESEALFERYWRGEWDAALVAADRLRERVDADTGDWALHACGLIRTEILLARGDLAGALDESEALLEFSRAAKAPQALLPALAIEARVRVALGDEPGAGALLDELFAAWPGSSLLPGFWTADAAAAAAALDRAEEAAAIAERASPRTRWVEAALAFLHGDYDAAADSYAAIGSVPDEAYARRRAAATEGASA
jgi:hypothetical protein